MVIKKVSKGDLPVRIDVAIDLIDDNPFNVRGYFNPQKVGELAESIKQIGLRQVPEARQAGDRYQLAYGHMRKRAFIRLNKDKPKEYLTMPLEVSTITDEQMMLYTVEENLKRSDVKPIEVARCIDNYFTVFPDAKETEVGDKLGFTQGHISNLRRVLTLPKSILEKVDEGKVSFTMARELLVFAGLQTARDRREKLDAEGLMKAACHGIGGSGYDAAPTTVDGLKKKIYEVAHSNFAALENMSSSYYSSGDIALFDYKAEGCEKCEHLFEAYETKTQKRHFCTDLKCFTKKQEEHKKKASAEARLKMVKDVCKRVEQEKPLLDKPKTISQEIPDAVALEAEAKATNRPGAKLAPSSECCLDCLNRFKCDGRSTEEKNGKMVCADKTTEKSFAKLAEKAKVEIPENLKALVAEAGTRGEVLDLNELRAGNYGLKEGYCELGERELGEMADPEECTIRCTKGFHFAFDSKPGYNNKIDERTHYVCTDRRCMGQKKAALTRQKNEEGTRKKAAERQAIKQAVDETTGMDAGRLKLVLLASLTGPHVQNHYYGNDAQSVTQWLGEKLGITKKLGSYDLDKDLLPALNKLNPVELARLVVEFSLKSLMHVGDIHNYKIETTSALNLLGIGINLETEKAKPAGATVAQFVPAYHGDEAAIKKVAKAAKAARTAETKKEVKDGPAKAQSVPAVVK